jgi:tetratricopeptide (TPR) repeat protein/DNA-binding XRE family transcriptional regulator
VAVTDTPTFGDLLRRYRLVAGLTQEALAERAHLSPKAIGALEQGINRAPRAGTLALLADALALSPQEHAALVAAARPQHTVSTGTARPEGSPPAHGGPLLVGRAQELAMLDRHLAGEGPPLLLLAGEPGIGKSRLLQETGARALRAGWAVLAGGCHRRGGQDPYAPLLPALERYIRAQSPAQLRAALRGCAWLVRLLPELADGPIEPLPDWTLSPEQERRLMVGAVAHFLGNVSGAAGTLLVLDDLHWAGADALDLLAALIHDAPEQPLRVIGSYRDTEVAPSDPLSALLATLASARLATRRSVRPLAPEEAAQLLSAVLDGADEAATSQRAQVLRRAGGVPFFLLSCAEALRLNEDVPPGAVPWDVAQSVRLRVAALPEMAQEVLGLAAVVGRQAPRALLLRAATRPDRAVLVGLQAACRARLLEENGPEEYQFAHDVIREVVEADLGVGQGALLHRDIALALEEAPGEAPVEALAYHYARAAEHARAGYWLERAGDRAAAGFANSTALEHYVAARNHVHTAGAEAALLSRLDEKAGDVCVLLGDYAHARADFAHARTQEREAARRAELWRKEGVSWHLLGEFEQALAAFAAAVADDDGPGVPGDVRVAIELSRGETLWRWGQYDAAQEAAEWALALLKAEEPGQARDLARARADHLLGRAAMTRGDAALAEACHRRSLALFERLGDQQGSAATWADLSWDMFQRGDLARAEEYGQHSLTIYERLGDQDGVGYACDRLCWWALLRGDLTAAEEYARRELASNDHSGARRHASSAWCALSWVACERGHLAEAEDDVRCALALLERSEHQGGPAGSSVAWNLLGTVVTQRGNLVEAEACFRRSLDIVDRTESGGFPGPISYAWQGLGRVAYERGDLAAAATWYRRARHLARRIGSTDVEADAALGLVCARWRGQPAGVRRRAATALLERGCAAATRHGFALPAVRTALFMAEVHLRQNAPAEARTAAEHALELATNQQRRWEEGVARRLLSQCALALGDPDGAEAQARAALDRLSEIGAELEAARARVALTKTLAAQAGDAPIPAEARTLRAEAQAQFIKSEAFVDLTRAEQMASSWQDGAPAPDR